MKRFLLMVCWSLLLPAQAESFSDTPGLLPTELVQRLLQTDPDVAAARANLEIAEHENVILDKSPYEWNARLSGQRRRVQDADNYREWYAGVERTVRLPRKATADRNIGKTMVQEYEARYGETLHKTAIELLTLWLDWVYAENSVHITNANVQTAEESLHAVQKRHRAGDAAKLELSLAHAELADQQRVFNDAQTQATVAWTRLHARFPKFDRNLVALPEVSPIKDREQFLRERILDQSDELKLAQAQLESAKANAERSRADHIPDPTVGLYTGSEFSGRERIVGVSISVPLPGSQRTHRTTQALLNVEVKRQELERIRRTLESEITGNIATAQGSYASLEMAKTGASAMRENAKLMQRAYTLGEVDLSSLLTAQRQATDAALNALTAQNAALKSFYTLLVDAHAVWGLGHE